jgi:hypothetical protein
VQTVQEFGKKKDLRMTLYLALGCQTIQLASFKPATDLMSTLVHCTNRRVHFFVCTILLDIYDE